MTRGKLALAALLAALLVVAVVAGVAWRGEPRDGAPTPVAALPDTGAASEAAQASSGARPPASVSAPPATAAMTAVAPASAALDPRVPAIDPPGAEPPPAQPWEIADPALYKAREKRLAQETNERFVQAADARLPPLNAAVVELRARNAPQADIDRAEDKIRHLQAVRGEPLVHEGAPPAASAP